MRSRPWPSAALAAATILLGWKCGGTDGPPGDFWSPMSSAGAPPGAGYGCPMLWTQGEALLIADARYASETDTWQSMSSAGAPGTSACAAVWTGDYAIVFGVQDVSGGQVASAARYDPVLDAWTPLSTTDAPAVYPGLTAVWTGTEVLVWGADASFSNAVGGRYDPATDTWETMSTAGAPEPGGVTAVWTGSEMILWSCHGIEATQCTNASSADGGRYDPATDTWTSTRLPSCSGGVCGTESVWTGSEMILWGERMAVAYDPVADESRSLSLVGAPAPSYGQAAVWTGSELLVWGGIASPGGRYDPTTETWTSMTTVGEPPRITFPAFAWTGSELIVWGDPDDTSLPIAGGRYTP